MFVFSPPAEKTNSLSESYYPTTALCECVANSIFGDYLIDSNGLKNILLASDRFERVHPDAFEVHAKVHFIGEMDATSASERWGGQVLFICALEIYDRSVLEMPDAGGNLFD